MMTIALLGFGTVGYGVYELLQNNENVVVKYVLDLTVHNDIIAQSVTDINVILNDPEVDTVVELIGGHNPAYGFITSAIKSGKNVITANKLVIAQHYDELTSLSKEYNVALRYTAAVGGGIPWLINLERTVKISKVNKIRGIFNGTTNFILDSMHRDGTSFDDALLTAQQLGFAEADPSSDIDGLDTQRKIAISSNIAYGVSVNQDEIDVIGIKNVSADIIKDCSSHGYICRLIAKSKFANGVLSCWVEPTFVKSDDTFASIQMNYNLISFDADNVGKTSFIGFGAGRYPTAYTVVGDCIDVSNGIKHTYADAYSPVTIDNSVVKHSYYVSTTADSEWINSNILERWNTGVLTEPVSISEMHKFYNAIKSIDPQIFIAGVY